LSSRRGEILVAFIEDLLKANPVTGVVVGIGVVLLSPIVLPVVGQIVRPAVKAAIKGGLVLYDQMAEIGEAASDLFAEAHAELGPEPSPPAGAGPVQHPPRSPAQASRRRQKSSA
jgi:hypothetical protein